MPPPKTAIASNSAGRGRERLAGAGDPLGQLVAAGLAALREQAARSTAGMPDA